MPQYAYINIHYTHLCKWSALSCYSSTAAFNNCYSEFTPYTTLANSYWASFQDSYQCQSHVHNDNSYSGHITADSCRTYLTNCMKSISHHITSLVINTLARRHTHTQTYISTIHTGTIFRNQVHTGLCLVCAWFKNHKRTMRIYLILQIRIQNVNICWSLP